MSLANEGFDVLRFDYFGTGDSSGDTEAGEADEWVRNTQTASRELAELARLADLSLVGMRLGALLACYACSESLTVRDLVLWDPVVDGAGYIRELEQTHDRRTQQWLHPRTDGAAQELVGFPFPRALRESLVAKKLSAIQPRAARITCVLPEVEGRADRDELANLWPSRATPVEVRETTEPGQLGDHVNREAILFADNASAAIVETLRS